MHMLIKRAQGIFMRYRISRTNTLPSVREKDRRYDETCADHARAELQKFVDDHGSQEAAAEALHLNQGTVSRALKQENQPSLKVIMGLSRKTRRTVDEILGLGKGTVAIETRIRDSQLQRVADAIAEQVAERLKSDRPPAREDEDLAPPQLPTIAPLRTPSLPEPRPRKPRK